MFIRGLDMLNLAVVVWFDFRFEPIFVTAPNAAKNHLTSFTKVQPKTLIHFVGSSAKQGWIKH
jgi:hypothetical protein